MELETHVRIQCRQPAGGGFDLGLADGGTIIKDLSLEVVFLDRIQVGQAEPADSGRRKVQRGRAAEPAQAHDQHARRRQPPLALQPDARQRQVAPVAGEFRGGEIGQRVSHGANAGKCAQSGLFATAFAPRRTTGSRGRFE